MLRNLATVTLLLCATAVAQAKVGADEAAALGGTLTPIGAEKAGNAAGTIPAWDGGLSKKEMGRDDHPFVAEQPLYTVAAANAKEHGKVLSEGHKALFRTFPDYKMKVYPSRRSASYPEWFYEATKRNATGVELTNSGAGFCCAARGYPFPIPKNGTEVMWNHIMRYNTKGFRGHVNHAAVQADGAHVVERAYLELTYVYNNRDTDLDELENRNLFLLIKTVSPPNKAGDANLLHVPIDRVKEATNVWLYNPSQGRVRRIGEVGYDNPLFDGLMTHDQVDMFNGPLDRYTIKLLGKKEMLVPYNSYALYSDRVKYSDIIKKGHINQDLARYELHRVWVIEAQARAGIRHHYKRRTFYVDEDSWLVLMQDMYDERDEFWRAAEAHPVNFADVPVVVNAFQVHYDLQSRRYAVLNMRNEEKAEMDYDWEEESSYYTPRQLQRFATTRNN